MSYWKSRDRKRPSTSGCACAHHSKGTHSGSRDLWSLPVAMVLVLLYYILYYYSKKTNAGNGCACAKHTWGSLGRVGCAYAQPEVVQYPIKLHP
jgi:hypothetical protein